MKIYNKYDSFDEYFENGEWCSVSLHEGEVTLEELATYCNIFLNKVSNSKICIDHIDVENNTIYIYSDVV